MTGQLFTHYFLTDGIKADAEWAASDAAFSVFRDGAVQAYQRFQGYQQPNEAVTEQELVRPFLELLGWTDYLPQQGAARNEDIPDNLLFIDAMSKDRAAGRGSAAERYRDAAVVEESKRFGLPLDTRDRDDRVQASTPHWQVRRYLETADIASDGGIRWGILTNGGVWRLYDYRARLRASGLSTRETCPWACRLTTAVSSFPKPLHCWACPPRPRGNYPDDIRPEPRAGHPRRGTPFPQLPRHVCPVWDNPDF